MPSLGPVSSALRTAAAVAALVSRRGRPWNAVAPRLGRHAGILKGHCILAAVLLGLVLATTRSTPSTPRPARTASMVLLDRHRDRPVPVELHFPALQRPCTAPSRCPVAFISPGLGQYHTDYRFVADALAAAGHLVVAIQHDLPSDPVMHTDGDPFTQRRPAWRRGADNLRFVRDALSSALDGYDWNALTLVGHAHGGDLSAFALHESPALAATLITLDHRHFPLPPHARLRVLSIRAADPPAGPGVLPLPGEHRASTCILTLEGARHDDMTDRGPPALKAGIRAAMLQFLRHGACPAGAPGPVARGMPGRSPRGRPPAGAG